MDRIARAVEPSMGYRHQMPEPGEETTVGRAMSNAACDLAETLGASAILVPTFTGRTASAVARLRPRRPIVGLSHHQTAVQQMALEWGVTPVPDAADRRRRGSLDALARVRASRRGVVESGDRVVTTAGTAVNLPGSTNVIKVDIASLNRSSSNSRAVGWTVTAGAYSIPEVQRLVATLVASKPGGRIAELGTSYGDGAKAILAALPPRTSFVTVEIDPDRAAQARQALAGTRGRGARGRLARRARRSAAPFDVVFADGGVGYDRVDRPARSGRDPRSRTT